jgi:hypothetical protein
MAQVTFESLNPSAPLFAELKSGKYAWWEKVKANPDLYKKEIGNELEESES